MTTYGPIGTLTRDEGVNVITFTRSFPAPPERVWTALTTVDGITSWLAPSAAIDARAGGSVEFEFDEENKVSGEITQYDPYSQLAHTWIINGEVPSAVRYELHPVDGGTELTLIHTRLPDEMCGGYTPGWHAYLVRLDAALSDSDLPDWMEIFEKVAPNYA